MAEDLPCGILSESYVQDMSILRTKTRVVFFVALFIAMAFLPEFTSKATLRIIILLLINVIAVQGLNITMGYAGQISLAQVGFMAAGGTSSAIFVTKLGIPFLPAMILAGCVTGIIGIIFGAPSLRIKGLYLTITTLAAHYIIMYFLVTARGLTGGSEGISLPRPLNFNDTNYYYLVAFLTCLFVFFTKSLVRTKTGRAFIAIRDNDIASEAMGINLFAYKLLAFFIGSFYAGVAGSLWGHFFTCVAPEQFSLMGSVWLIGMLVVGGSGSVIGAIYGVIFLTILKEAALSFGSTLEDISPFLSGIASPFADILFAAVIVVFLIWEPRGLAHRWELVRAYFRIWPFAY